ncbi:MAG: heat-inducible transcription repressor HrcA [Ignavibacteriales bacterium UTCHB2]|jgi:heat-inducible transcriptional repressor|nr:MAG: Heat-inducible transcription repressor HrcA [Ignavibacteria bacterium ADurb.Bin266]OQY73759.1 MAG: heat-inducible transcription repressor HrcA [Ignavibacteriales bacterium UTCHB2]HQI40975.1 heat-inducible transcriptional repressor HrcA [Ignavibacteriaceae bacterium]
MSPVLHENLNEREKLILRSIVQQFILTAAPVGSRNITRKFDVGVSPATVRNIMSELEDSGFINHPHTSAGRIPTDKGYRYYVDSLMEISALNSTEKSIIEKGLDSKLLEKEQILKVASKLLSNITKQIACVTYPTLDKGILTKIQLVSLSSTRMLVVVSIQSGLIKTITLEFESEIEESSIPEVESILNERLSGLTFQEIRQTAKERLINIEDVEKPIMRLFVDSVDKIFTDVKPEEKILITGATNIIQQPEFEDPEKFQSVIELIEDKDIIIHILDKKKPEKSDNILISIGTENEDEKLHEYSLITKEYSFGETSGTVGIIGPKRMEYSKVVAIISYLGDMLTEVLTGNK